MMMATGSREATKGFTLLEILVVMVLMGMAITLVAPTVGAGLDSFRLQAAGSQIVTAFRLAQTTARLQQTSIVAVYSNHSFVFSRNHQVIRTLELSPLIQPTVPERPLELIAYLFLPTGQVLGPRQFHLVTVDKARMVVFSLGPTPSQFGIGGTVQ